MELNPIAVSEAARIAGMAPEVFTKFLLKDTPEAEVTPLLEGLKGLEVHSAADFTARITRERSEAAKEAERIATGNAYGAQDKRILADTGVAKNDGESTIDYMARAAKEKYGTKADESAEMKRLRETLEAKDVLLNTATTKLQEMEVSNATERKQSSINAAIDGPINELSIQVSDARFLPSQRKLVKAELAEKYSIDVVDGQVQFTDKATGKVKTDPKKAGNPMDAATLIAEFAPTVVSLKKESAKTGSGFESSSTNLNDGDAASFDFAQYTTKEDFAKALNKAGISSGSKRGGELYVAFEKARPDLK